MTRGTLIMMALMAIPAAGLWAQTLPEDNNGMARRHPRDIGIESDANAVFVEKFDESSISAMSQRYTSVLNSSIMSLVTDVPTGAANTKSLLMTHVGGQNNGGHLYRPLLPGYDQLFIRWYVKFDPNCYQIHHFGTCMGGYNPSTPWPQGGAGIAPTGADHFNTQLDTFSNWTWGFYTYWKDMRAGGDGGYWGNTFTYGVPGSTGLSIPKGRWICVELMLKLNNPVTEKNGEQAFWIDGKLIRYNGQIVSYDGKGFPKGSWTWGLFAPNSNGQPLEGFQWRTVDALKLNWIWTELYITDAPSGRVSKVWFDNIVVAKEYIGPIATQPAPVAEAGPDGIAYEAHTCTLDGSASTNADTYAWTQLSGKPVTLQNPNTAKPSFVVPKPASKTEAQLSFKLTVTNTTGSSSDTVNYRIRLLGDANGDDCVDSADRRVWLMNYDPLAVNQNSFEMGDFNGDGKIDSADRRIWLLNYNPLGLPSN